MIDLVSKRPLRYGAERQVDTYEAQHTLPSTMHPVPQASSLERQLD
jgi:hypothetical protein